MKKLRYGRPLFERKQSYTLKEMKAATQLAYSRGYGAGMKFGSKSDISPTYQHTPYEFTSEQLERFKEVSIAIDLLSEEARIPLLIYALTGKTNE